MAVTRRKIGRTGLTQAQWLNLRIDDSFYKGCGFKSERNRREAYFDYYKPRYEHNWTGWRPGAWWQYEAPGQRLEGETHLAALVRLGCASEAEKGMYQHLEGKYLIKPTHSFNPGLCPS
jgi:hypothetical protein